MAELGKSTYTLDLKLDQFLSGLAKASTAFKTFESRAIKAFDRVSERGARLRNIGAIVSAAITAPLALAGKSALSAASDVQEMRNLAAVTFGQAIRDVEAWAEAVAQATGRSRFEFLRMASDFAAFLKPLGVAPDMIAPASEALAQLAADISSFRNISVEEARVRLFSGLAGETEAVRRLGIDLGEAALSAELMRLGLAKSAQTATQAQKVMARLSLILRQTKDAQGDLVRTQTSYENLTRSLFSALFDLRVAFGEVLLPVMTPIVQRLRDMVREMAQLPAETKRTIAGIALLVGGIGPLLVVAGFAVQGLAGLGRGLLFFGRIMVLTSQLVIGAIVGMIRWFGLLVTAYGGVPVAVGALITAMVALGVAFRRTLSTIFSPDVLSAVGAAARTAVVRFIVNPLIRAFNMLLRGLDFVRAKIADMMLDIASAKFLPVSVRTLALAVGASMQGVIGQIDEVALDLEGTYARLGEAGSRVAAQASEDWQSIKDAVAGAIAKIKGLLGSFSVDLPETIASAGGDTLKQLEALARKLQGMTTGTGQAVASTWQSAFEHVSSAAEQAFAQAVVTMRGFGDAAKSIVQQVLSEIVRLLIIRPILGSVFKTLGLPVPGFAQGGFVRGGQPIVVGERGPELFVPPSSGKIVPNHRLGGERAPSTVQQSFSFGAVFPETLEAAIINIAAPAGRDAALQVLRAAGGVR